MFKLLSYSGTLAAWKIRYCNGPFETCARYQRSKDGRAVPVNLMPNGAMLKRAEDTAK